MSFGDQLFRWWAHRKLSRGRCRWCAVVLPDDNQTNFCSEDHRADWNLDRILG